MGKVNMWIATVEVQKAVDFYRACQRRSDKKVQLSRNLVVIPSLSQQKEEESATGHEMLGPPQ